MPKDIKGVVEEFEKGKLHSGSKHGPEVKSKAQALAIGYSEQAKLKHSEKPHFKGITHVE